MRYSLAASMLTAMVSAEYHSAVLVAGSSGYWNYRHQADIAHAYQILINNGMAPENIITFMYDDIAQNSQNPFPGQLFNAPNGKDVYNGVKIDYSGKDVTPEKFMAVMTGDAETAGGRVLQTDLSSRVFVNFSDHGGPGLIAFPSEYLYADQLQQTIDTMESKEMFGEMVFYIEACESGSMFPKLRADQNVYAVTAANATQSSYAAYCSPEDTVNGVSIGSCLGDEFSVNWMQDTESNNPYIETLKAQTNIVRERTIGSQVQNFGDNDFVDEPLANFEGNNDNMTELQKYISYAYLNPNDYLFAPQTSKSLVDSRDVKMHYLYKRVEKNGDMNAHQELMTELESRMGADNLFKELFPHHAEANELTVIPENFECLRFLMGVHDLHCGRFDDYSLKYVKHLVHACETEAPEMMGTYANLI